MRFHISSVLFSEKYSAKFLTNSKISDLFLYRNYKPYKTPAEGARNLKIKVRILEINAFLISNFSADTFFQRPRYDGQRCAIWRYVYPIPSLCSTLSLPFQISKVSMIMYFCYTRLSARSWSSFQPSTHQNELQLQIRAPDSQIISSLFAAMSIWSFTFGW